ncbi:MAG: class I SAM-dependent methyltransferase [Candidatus Eisenbacteria bacterium]|nr:class I SAM-dependent methyltransferase [Candidatus Eisenbacteria bacterium]
MNELMQARSQDRSLLQFGNPISASQYLRLYRLVARYVRAGATVLDWGVGNGHFSYFLVRSGYRTSGYGFERPPQVCSAFAPGSYEYRSGNSNDPITLPYSSQSFDAVLAVGVLEHVRETGGDELSSFKEINRILKPKGVFICFHLPNRYSWIEASLRLINRWSHRYRYAASDILSLAKNADFEVVEIQRYAILPRNVWWWGVPGLIRVSFRMANLYGAIDNALSALISPVCQNYLFVAQKQKQQYCAVKSGGPR